MTEQEKDEVIVALCGYLPYGLMCRVKLCFRYEDGTIRRGSSDQLLDLDTIHKVKDWYESDELEGFKLYLRPISSITEEEYNKFIEYSDIKNLEFNHEESHKGRLEYLTRSIRCTNFEIDWFNKNHIDYRNFIEKGLALEAPEDMYNTKTE